MVLVLSYILTYEPNCYIQIWYENNSVRYLYHNANVKNQIISEFLAKIGETDKEILFHKLYNEYPYKYCNLDNNIFIDSAVINNDICFYYTTFTKHNENKQKNKNHFCI